MGIHHIVYSTPACAVCRPLRVVSCIHTYLPTSGLAVQVMTELTDAVQGAKGKTVLYAPQDDLEDTQEIARDQASLHSALPSMACLQCWQSCAHIMALGPACLQTRADPDVHLCLALGVLDWSGPCHA